MLKAVCRQGMPHARPPSQFGIEDEMDVVLMHRSFTCEMYPELTSAMKCRLNRWRYQVPSGIHPATEYERSSARSLSSCSMMGLNFAAVGWSTPERSSSCQVCIASAYSSVLSSNP